jgi:hypothetical protein
MGSPAEPGLALRPIPLDPARVTAMLAPFVAASAGHGWGLLEWFFAGLLAFLVGVVGLFFLYLVLQLFINPARRPRRL